MAILHIASSFIVVFLALCILHAPSTTGGSALNFSAELIHRDSPESPLYDPMSTPFSRFRAAIHRSAHRANYFHTVTVNSYLISSNVINYVGDYMMELYMGSPAKYSQKVHALLDTGSGLISMLCNPCKKCYLHNDPVFDSITSNTYKKIPCKSKACSSLAHIPCSINSLCKVKITYGDDSTITGFLSRETIGFFDGKIRIRVPRIIFVCAHHTTGTFSDDGIGVIGLNGGSLSLIRQLNLAIGISIKFAYCLPPDNGNSGRIYFGSTANVPGPMAMTTPLFIGVNDLYYLNMEEIVVSGPNRKPLHFSIRHKKGEQGQQGNIVLDSGTAFTFIEEYILNSLLEELMNIINRTRVENPEGILDICYDWTVPVAEEWMPIITFYFANGMKLEISKPFGLIEENIMCLAVTSNHHMDGMSIFGSMAHSGYHTEYDLDARMLTVIPKRC